MKIKLWLLCVLIFWLGYYPAEGDEHPPLKVQGVKARYSLDETVTIAVTNLTSGEIRYGIGILYFHNGRWHEYITNLADFQFISKDLGFQHLAGDSSDRRTWTPKRLQKPYSVGPGTYRFYVALSRGKGDDDALRKEASTDIGREVGLKNKQLLFSEAFELYQGVVEKQPSP